MIHMLKDVIWRLARSYGRIYKHKKRGSEYACVGIAYVQCSTEPITEDDAVMVYIGENGCLYVRKLREFYDGRFEAVNR